MPKRDPCILFFASVKHPTRVSLCCVKTLNLWKWALLNPDLLMVDYPRHRLSKLLPAVVIFPFDPCSGQWHLQLPLRGGGGSVFFHFVWASWHWPDQRTLMCRTTHCHLFLGELRERDSLQKRVCCRNISKPNLTYWFPWAWIVSLYKWEA